MFLAMQNTIPPGGNAMVARTLATAKVVYGSLIENIDKCFVLPLTKCIGGGVDLCPSISQGVAGRSFS